MVMTMKKEFKLGMEFESNTEYFFTQSELNVHLSDTVIASDDRYVALRAHDTKEFNVFALIKDKENITIDFGGAILVMHGRIQPFLIDNSRNITIKNCCVTYQRPPLTEALILETTPEYARLRLNDNCTCRIKDGRLVPYCDTWENNRLNYRGYFFQVFDKETRKGCGLGLGVMGNTIISDPKWPYNPDKYVVEEDGDDIILKGTIHDFYKPGRVLVITHETRSLSSVFMIDTKGVTLYNYRILLGCGMGIYAYRAEDITLDGLCLTYDEKSPCLIANAADAIHTFGTSGKFVIKNTTIEGTIDDAVNIHSNFRTVKSASGNEIISNLASCELQATDLYRAGDEIAVYNGNTMDRVATYTIKGIETVDKTTKKFILEQPVAEHSEGDLIENLTANCNVTIENSVFGKANTHLRLQSRGKVVIRNCETELPLLLSGDTSYWFESGPLTDFTVENCKFIGERAMVWLKSEVMPSEENPYYHKNLKIINNEFETTVPLSGGYADGIVFKGNINSKCKQMTLSLTNCGTVDAENVIVERKTEVKEKLGIN